MTPVARQYVQICGAIALAALAGCFNPTAATPDTAVGDAQSADSLLADTASAPLDAPAGNDGNGATDSAAFLDFSAADLGKTADVAVAPGSFGAPCQTNGECDSNYCVPGPAGTFCTKLCVETCPDGYTCAGTGSGSDINYICIARWQHLCDPCTENAACVDPLLGAGALCLSYGNDGAYCGSPCNKEGDCPSGYACSGEPGAGGQLVGQCRRTSGLCNCNASAMAAKLTTACGHESPFGECKGIRGCSDQGLSPCTAAIPKAETCNAKDDNCDGSTDENIATAPCVSSNGFGVCAGETSCAAGKTACTAKLPAKETCNGQDDNCNGETDEAACDDGNPCTEDACNLTVGGCVFAQVTKLCNDGDVCTTSDICKAGLCGGDPVQCSDDDPCTADTCDSKAAKPGCQFASAPNGSCDDGDPCTGSDACLAGNGAKLTCTGTGLADGTTCSDGNACTLAAACTVGKCKATATACDDANPCTDDSCDAAASGACKHFYNIAACDDGNPCTLGDSCFAGKCLGLGKTPCDDNEACTADACDPKGGGCVHTPKVGASCTDGDLCTTGDACALVSGKPVCTGAGLKCDDGKACTSDACNSAFGCEHVFIVGPCDDGDACTKGDNCLAGQCLPGGYGCGECVSNSDCKAKEDGDLCNGTLYCEKQGHTCVVDAATVVQCPAPIGGAALCIVATCDAKSGKCAIAPANEGGTCDDSNACTAKDACKKGGCSGTYGNLACDDANPCTQDACSAATGCASTVLEGVPCNDGDACSQSDVCAGGKCKSGNALSCDDGNPCTTDGCDASKGCVHNVNTLPCSDGNVCTTGDNCLNAVCTPKAAFDCDDGNICTADFCDAKTGCQHTPAAGIQCNDGNACTAADKCTGGQCLGGGQLPCSDGNICTADACDPKSGCTFTPNTLACNDGNACTDSDACQGGGCKAGKPLDCNDANTCTVDLCDPAKGCTYQKVIDTTPCNDGDLCTVSDKCSGGICLPGTKLACNDSQACTTDSCEPKTGCVYTALAEGSMCDDASICTLVDKCAAGKCTGAGTKDLDKDGHIDSKCPNGDDCDDACALCFAGQKEVCDDLDNDCKLGVDDGCDDDNDDYCDSAMTIPVGIVPKTCSKGGGDCSDGAAAINPGAAEKLEIDVDHVARGEPFYYNNPASGPLGLAVAADGTLWASYAMPWSGLSPGTATYLASRSAVGTQWTMYPMPERGGYGGAAIAIDALGLPHVAYSRGNLVRHAVLNPASGWTTETVSTEAAVPAHLTIAARTGATGADVHVAWYDSKNTELRYTSRKAGQWTLATVDSTGDVGQFASIAVDGKGAVHIAYLDSTNHDVRYATDAGSAGAFVVTTVDGADGAAGFYTALALDSKDKVHIAHYELLGSDLRYTSNASGAWTTEIIDAPGTVGQQATIAIGSDDVVHFSYRDDDNARIKHAWGNAGSWTKEKITAPYFDQNLPTSQRAPMVVSGATPFVFWGFDGSSSSNGYIRLKLAKRGAASWTTEFIDELFGNNSGYMGQFAGRSRGQLAPGDVAVLGSSGSSSYSSLIVGRWLGAGFAFRGYTDKLTKAKINLNSGNFDLSSGGVVHACGSNFAGGGNTTLLYVSGTWDDGFTSKVIDAATKVGTPCKLALDKAGVAHIVYYDSGNQVMRYRNVTNGVPSTGDVPDAAFGTGSVLDLTIAADGALWAVYGGAGLRVATSQNGLPWSAEILGTDAVNAVAIVALADGSLSVFYQTTAGIKSRTRKLAAWEPEISITTSTIGAQRLAATLDVDSNIHLGWVASGTDLLSHTTNRFGGWSQVSTGVAFGSSAASLDILTGKDGRVLVVGSFPGASGKPDNEVSFTYQNLVDDNCDGK